MCHAKRLLTGLGFLILCCAMAAGCTRRLCPSAPSVIEAVRTPACGHMPTIPTVTPTPAPAAGCPGKADTPGKPGDNGIPDWGVDGPYRPGWCNKHEGPGRFDLPKEPDRRKPHIPNRPPCTRGTQSPIATLTMTSTFSPTSTDTDTATPTFTPTDTSTNTPTNTSTPIPTCPGVSTAQTRFVAFDDFSFSSNPVPSGAWRYGYQSTLGGAFVLYEYKSSDYQKVGTTLPLSLWQGDPARYDPNVIKNENGVTIMSNFNWVYHPVTVYLHFHPGPHNEYSVIRWTCPADGTYQVDAAFISLRMGGPQTTSDVHVLLNGSPLYGRSINAHFSDGEFPFAATLAMKACDTLDFTVGYGDNGNYYYDSSGVRAAIEGVTAP